MIDQLLALNEGIKLEEASENVENNAAEPLTEVNCAPEKQQETQTEQESPTTLVEKQTEVVAASTAPAVNHKEQPVPPQPRRSSVAPSETSSTKMSGATKPVIRHAGLQVKPAPPPKPQKRPVFDLKASLARPLSYKPYVGKLIKEPLEKK